MPEHFEYDVFLSHSTKDKAIVRAIAKRLRSDGLNVWFDEWILKAGDNVQKKIDEGLDASRVLILCMSANAFSSDWSQLEAGTFRFRDPLNQERRFIPVRLDDAPIKGSLAQFLYISWLPKNRKRNYPELLKACSIGRSLIEVTFIAERSRWSTPAEQEVVADRNWQDKFSRKTKDVLSRGVGMICSNPACRYPTCDPKSNNNNVANIGVAVRIAEAKEGDARYDKSLSSRELLSINNAIWLCQNCASLVGSDQNRYSARVLHEWKKNAESYVLNSADGNKILPVSGYNSMLEVSSVGGEAKAELRFKLSGSCPFYSGGAMGEDAKSYIARTSDNRIKSIAKSHSFIWVQGDFQYGKTSLLIRNKYWLGRGWDAIYVDLQLCDRSSDSRFRRDLFAEIGEEVGMQLGWREFRDLLKRQKIAIILDELGSCRNGQIVEVLECFHSLAERAPGNLKLIVSVREGPGAFLLKHGIQNPKHRDAWEIVALGPLSMREVNKLIGFFPDPISSILHSRIDRVQDLTEFEPNRVQKLFGDLWKVYSLPNGSSEATELFIDSWLRLRKSK